MAVSLLTLFEYVFGVNVGIDEMLGPSYITVKLSSPGRMSPVGAICFVSSAVGLVLASGIPSKRAALVLGLSGSIVAAVGMATAMAFALGSSDAFGWGTLTRQALHTAVGLCVLGLGMLVLAWRVETDAASKSALVADQRGDGTGHGRRGLVAGARRGGTIAVRARAHRRARRRVRDGDDLRLDGLPGAARTRAVRAASTDEPDSGRQHRAASRRRTAHDSRPGCRADGHLGAGPEDGYVSPVAQTRPDIRLHHASRGMGTREISGVYRARGRGGDSKGLSRSPSRRTR